MKKHKIVLITIIIVAILALIGGHFLLVSLVDENNLSINEKKWIDSNNSKVISISIPNDLAVFGSNGEGVFFDYVEYFKKETGLEVNINTISYNSTSDGNRFQITNGYEKNGSLLFKDHYVLISKQTGLVSDSQTIPTLAPAVLNKDLEQVRTYYDVQADNFKSYDTYSKITEDLTNGTIAYALVPLNEYKDELISNNINVLYHVSDLNKYYYLMTSGEDVISTIFNKTFESWKKDSFEKSYNKNNYKLFISMLKITEAEEATLTNKVYKYGFAENRPYEVLASSQYGGITAQYLRSFSDFSGVEFTYKKYKTSTELVGAALSNKIDLYYNYYNIITNYIDCGALKDINYYVIADNSIDLSMSNINGIANQTVYVLKNSYLYDAINEIEGIKVVTYEKVSELKSVVNKANILVVDEYTYDYYINKISNNYSVRYKGQVDQNNYTFKYSNDKDTFYKLFSAYTKTINPQDLLRNGIITYNGVVESGKVVGFIAKSLLFVIAVGFVAAFIIKKKTTTVKLNTKVKKEDRLKYIDLLTSLKNRNYYNEKLNVWNKNRIYPQTCIVLDINSVKMLNDSYGHEEGDKQIQAVANVLIKTQVDNSEIIRTDGNEFFVYMIGYSEKQVLSYIKKLVKEFKKLPYETGVAMGFSMIEDDTKLVEDAFNEASIRMRENKELTEGANDDKKD